MTVKELIQIKNEYEVDDISQYIALLNTINEHINIDLNNGEVFQKIVNNFFRLTKLENPSEEDINSYLINERDLLTFAPLVPIDDKMHQNNISNNFFYRGVYDGEKFNLLPSAIRGNRYGKEDKYYHFVKAQCSSEYNGLSLLNTLVKMQHYDCPTRLLDLTSNPLVALFFACKNFGCNDCQKANFGYVYIFIIPENKVLFDNSDKAVVISCLARLDIKVQFAIYNSCINKIKKDGFDATFDANNNGYAIEKLYHEIRMERNFDKKLKAIDLLKNYYILPDKSNVRIKLQSGGFLLPGLHKNKNDYEKSMNNEYFVRIKIKNQEDILKQLDLLNINEASLFPEIDKVAKYYVDKL